jgi:hypothetical protein
MVENRSSIDRCCAATDRAWDAVTGTPKAAEGPSASQPVSASKPESEPKPAAALIRVEARVRQETGAQNGPVLRGEQNRVGSH